MSTESSGLERVARIRELIHALVHELGIAGVAEITDRAYEAQCSRCSTGAEREELRRQIDQAFRGIDDVIAPLQADPEFPAKLPCVLAAMDLTCACVPPALWTQIFRDAYALLDGITSSRAVSSVPREGSYAN